MSNNSIISDIKSPRNNEKDPFNLDESVENLLLNSPNYFRISDGLEYSSDDFKLNKKRNR